MVFFVFFFLRAELIRQHLIGSVLVQLPYDDPVLSDGDISVLFRNDKDKSVGVFADAQSRAVARAHFSADLQIMGNRKQTCRRNDAVLADDHGAVMERSTLVENITDQFFTDFRIDRGTGGDDVGQRRFLFKNDQCAGVSVGKTEISVSDSLGYETTLEVRVTQGKQKLTAKSKKVKIKYKKLKKKKKTFKRSKIMKLSGVKTKATYKITSVKKKKFKKYFKINAETGKLTVKKKLKKGKYKVKVKVSAAGTKDYKAATKTVTTTVKVK